MVRASKKPVTDVDDERSRLKKLSITRNILSQTPSNSSTSLNLSKTVLKHHGTDILKKSQRKNRFLFSFPGLLGPLAGGKIGELTDLGTKTPILYLDFPQGRVKMFGTIVYTKNRYLTLQFSKGGKNVMCEDHFDNMVVFSDAWWIGKKDENPEEVQLDYPKHMIEGKHTETDFKGGAGAGTAAAFEQKSGPNKPRKEYVEPESSSADMADDSEDVVSLNEKNKDLMEATPVRQSSRTAGKKFKFTEASSGDSSAESDSDRSDVLKEESNKEKLDDVMEDPNLVFDAIDSVDDAAKDDILEQESTFQLTPKETSVYKRAPLVQSTISTLFEKVKGKDGGRKNKVTPTKGGKFGAGNSTRKKKSQVEDDDIEEFSESEDIEESDDEWVA